MKTLIYWSWLLVIGYWLLVIGYWLLSIISKYYNINIKIKIKKPEK